MLVRIIWSGIHMASTGSFLTLLRAVRPLSTRNCNVRAASSSSSLLHDRLRGYHCRAHARTTVHHHQRISLVKSSTFSAARLCNLHQPQAAKSVPAPHKYSVLRHLSYDVGSNLLQVVEGELTTEAGVKQRQLELLKSITSDVSEPNKQLLTKLNCTTKLSGEEVYSLAVAVFNSRNHGDVSRDSDEIAASLFEYSGELGDTNALYTFAQLLRTGQGVTPDAPRAATMFTDLAMKGHPYAQFALAGMYYGGLGVEQSFNRAFTLYSVSAKNFIPQAHTMLGEMYRLGQGVEENQEEAVKHYKTGAEQGDPLAHMSLAHCYTHGKGVEASTAKAFEHHQEASKSNNPVALYNVGAHYFSGKGVGLSFKKAAEYFEKAAVLGFPPAQVNLGNMYYNGLGVSQDKVKAKELYKLAAEKDKHAKALLEELEAEEKKAKEKEGTESEKT